MGRLVIAAIVIATFGGAGMQLHAEAQQANFGTVRLRRGFRPDPKVVEGRSGGSHAARERSSSCRGYVSTNPDYILRVQGTLRFLRIFVEANTDTTLIIEKPNGDIVCDDDTYGRNPAVEQERFRPGRYKIWVGSYSQGNNAPYQLVFTSNHDVTPGHPDGTGGASQVDVSGESSNFADTWLEPGFDPDPQKITGTLGGDINATSIAPGCNGWVTRAPDHLFNIEGSFEFMRVFAQSESDTTLVIRAPDGTFHCNDDSNGLHPAISLDRWSPGQYLIWVGSYQRGDRGDYSVGFTENRNTVGFRR